MPKTGKIKFLNSERQYLVASIHAPFEHSSVPFAIFAHCFTCSRNLKAINNICDNLSKRGIGVLHFDFTGLGESEGDFSKTNFSTNVADIVSAYEYLEQQGVSVKLLIGHSFGGSSVLQAAGDLPGVRAVVTIGAPSEPSHIAHLMRESIDEIESKGCAEVILAGRRFIIKKQFLDNLKEHRIEHKVKNLGKALLVMHSPADETVSIENAQKIFFMAKHPRSFVSLDNADHLLTKEQDSRYTANIMAVWCERYITT